MTAADEARSTPTPAQPVVPLRPTVVPPRPTVPPPPAAPPTEPAVLGWLRTPRPEADLGVWRYGYRPRADLDPDRTPLRRLVGGALLSALIAWMLWSFFWAGYFNPYVFWPLTAMAPDDPEGFAVATYIYYVLVGGTLVVAAARLGHWPELVRRLVLDPLRESARAQAQAAPSPAADPAQWPELRAAGATEAADRLAADARAGRMTDVDVARIAQAWTTARASGSAVVQRFAAEVGEDGASAFLHPSGARDVPQRAAAHDLLARQVRIGTAADHKRTPHRRRGAGVALAPSLLGTSLLAVGPSGSGKTSRVVRPVAESLCLQALAGQAAVVAVGPASADRGPADAYDVVVRLGRGGREGDADLDLYGGTTDPDEAAGTLAEGLVGDLGQTQRATAALRQTLDPFRAAHNRFPTVPELRELLDGDREATGALRTALKVREDTVGRAALREMDARARQAERSGDVGELLADRLGLLDRPVFAGRFDPTGRTRQVSMRAIDRPLRVRIDLPDRGHTEASRILARLILAQFTECATARTDRSLFACLVLDDAAHTITAEALRGLQRLRSANAGAVLTLRSLEDVPEALRSGLLGAVGCRMALSGVTTWDGAPFADTWGKEWVESRDVTDRQIVAEGAGQKASHLARQLITGKPVTAQAVTVRHVERERWSASDLAGVQAGHAVLSVTAVSGETAPPILVNLR
ncbi:type IV secretory system conjugative DNA transfer family protein [Streptomyces tubercidicus]|uniref:ATP-binding protein n=1 Tax=Streptomyces tubercidicus TaxID=47759 RepID=UPI0036B8C7F4